MKTYWFHSSIPSRVPENSVTLQVWDLQSMFDLIWLFFFPIGQTFSNGARDQNTLDRGKKIHYRKHCFCEKLRQVRMTTVFLEEARSLIFLCAFGNTTRHITFLNLHVCALPTCTPTVLYTGQQESFRNLTKFFRQTLSGKASELLCNYYICF